jgi:hypothetical protein
MACGRIDRVGTEVPGYRTVFTSSRSEYERGRGGGPDGISSIIVWVGICEVQMDSVSSRSRTNPLDQLELTGWDQARRMHEFQPGIDNLVDVYELRMLRHLCTKR